MIDVFGWIRRKAAESVVNGVADGLRAVTPEGEEVPDIAELRALLATATEAPKQLAAPSEEEPVKRGRK